ncbi:FAD-dependent oxidoreductase [Candidatus Parabeggiatoa sp. HSG14]|uniref:FAD-dependent oxidoreductase n=1 Tax=Candidatus Parabeggiatoa sp. HSG14 TaxID=3055593 RepID=UPI0025A7475E|nr:FAD-dependent oxidoreductase [Thiotrichales bacterium HSG14]
MANFKSNFQGITFESLFQTETLQKLDQQFIIHLHRHSPSLRDDLLTYRSESQTQSPLQTSKLLLACAPILETFIADLFDIDEPLNESHQQVSQYVLIFEFKKWFVLRRAKRRLAKKEPLESFAELDAWLTQALENYQVDDRELAVSQLAKHYLTDKKSYAEEIEKLTRWCIRALNTEEGQAAVRDWISFYLPQPINHANLVPIAPVSNDTIGRLEGSHHTRRQREGFKLTDSRMSIQEVQSEINYCIYCHEQNGDFCSKGFPEKKGQPDLGLKTDPLGNILTGCPLDEKISEMHLLKREGYTIAALAMVMVDNPMCPVTGHRICNDCMKSCIYQKQEPVNIPQIETRVLTDVLKLPWGVEIYDLLTRWNPLRQQQWIPKPYNGLKVLIMGQGPAGFTLAHHLLMEGFAVVGVDGLKIEPLPEHFIKKPIFDYASLEEELDERVMAGFGGVAEYGITVRWDKNFLKLIYLSLLRRPYFQLYGNVRFGGTLTVEDAWELGFDHIAIAVGAGLPQALPIPGSLAPGMRQATDFLMSLQLTGAANKNSLANLQVRLPAVVIGGGLTAIDTATEVQAYYLIQIEKVLSRYEQLVQVFGENKVHAQLDKASLDILREFLAHAKELRTERERAKTAGVELDIQNLIHKWGGVTVAYRRSMQESPAYKRNHEEITKALEEGIFYAEGLEPKAVQLDKQGHVQSLVCQKRIHKSPLTPTFQKGEQTQKEENWQTEEIILPARAIFAATGAKPNVAYEFEHRGHFKREGVFQYQPYHNIDNTLQPAAAATHCKEKDFGPFTSYEQQNHRVTFIGDTHPTFHGSVVKAVASAMRTYPHIVESFDKQVKVLGDEAEYSNFYRKMQDLLQARIEQVQRHSHSVVELKIRVPIAAKKFRPGQFFRLQNFETHAPILDKTRLQTETLAMRCAKVDPEKGFLSFMVFEQGVSSRLCATFRPGDPISLMGPTGVQTKIYDSGETVMIIADRTGSANAQSVGSAMRSAGNRVLYIADFHTADEVYCQDDLENAADTIVWITFEGEPVPTRRPQDCAASGNFLYNLTCYAKGELSNGSPTIPLQEVTRVLIMGSNHFVRMINEGRRSMLREYFSKSPPFTASVHNPMQCMLKGVCSQCLQWQIDPATGQRTKAVFACSWQDQPLDIIDIDNLDERVSQNHLQEHLSNLWLDYLFAHYEIERV